MAACFATINAPQVLGWVPLPLPLEAARLETCEVSIGEVQVFLKGTAAPVPLQDTAHSPHILRKEKSCLSKQLSSMHSGPC